MKNQYSKQELVNLFQFYNRSEMTKLNQNQSKISAIQEKFSWIFTAENCTPYPELESDHLQALNTFVYKNYGQNQQKKQGQKEFINRAVYSQTIPSNPFKTLDMIEDQQAPVWMYLDNLSIEGPFSTEQMDQFLQQQVIKNYTKISFKNQFKFYPLSQFFNHHMQKKQNLNQIPENPKTQTVGIQRNLQLNQENQQIIDNQIKPPPQISLLCDLIFPIGDDKITSQSIQNLEKITQPQLIQMPTQFLEQHQGIQQIKKEIKKIQINDDLIQQNPLNLQPSADILSLFQQKPQQPQFFIEEPKLLTFAQNQPEKQNIQVPEPYLIIQEPLKPLQKIINDEQMLIKSQQKQNVIEPTSKVQSSIQKPQEQVIFLLKDEFISIKKKGKNKKNKNKQDEKEEEITQQVFINKKVDFQNPIKYVVQEPKPVIQELIKLEVPKVQDEWIPIQKLKKNKNNKDLNLQQNSKQIFQLNEQSQLGQFYNQSVKKIEPVIKIEQTVTAEESISQSQKAQDKEVQKPFDFPSLDISMSKKTVKVIQQESFAQKNQKKKQEQQQQRKNQILKNWKQEDESD